MFFGIPRLSWSTLILGVLVIDMGIDIYLLSIYRLKDDQVPIQTRVQKSYFRNLVTEAQARRYYQSAPGLTSFIVGLDPRASRYAQFRWIFLATIGWMQFCLLSPWGGRIVSHDPGVTRLHLLASPFAMLIFYYPFRFIARLLFRFDWWAGMAWTAVFKSLAGILCALLTIVSLLSPFATVVYILWKLCRFSIRTSTGIGCGIWRVGERMFGIPENRFGHAIHTWVERFAQRKETRRYNLSPRRAELPGPIVRRVEIGGVKYDI